VLEPQHWRGGAGCTCCFDRMTKDLLVGGSGGVVCTCVCGAGGGGARVGGGVREVPLKCKTRGGGVRDILLLASLQGAALQASSPTWKRNAMCVLPAHWMECWRVCCAMDPTCLTAHNLLMVRCCVCRVKTSCSTAGLWRLWRDTKQMGAARAAAFRVYHQQQRLGFGSSSSRFELHS